MTTTSRDAAQARAAAGLSLRDRPSQRRNSEAPIQGMPRVRARVSGIQIRLADSDSSSLNFTGYASVTEAPYVMWDMFGPFTEIVSQGAFAETLAQPNLDVPLVLQHDSLRRIARTTNGTLQLAEDDQGLSVAAQLDPADADVAYIVPKMRSGLIDEMSFAFSITSGQWSPDYTEFRINAVDINRGDVAIVGYGANPATNADVRASSIERQLATAGLEDLQRYQRIASERLRELSPAPSMTLAQALRLP